MEIFKEGKALPRWVENVVITASKIKGCSLDGDDDEDTNDNEDGEEEEAEAPLPPSSPVSSTREGNNEIY